MTRHCPECGEQLHSIAGSDRVFKCFNGPKYWREEDGQYVDVTSEFASTDER